MSSRRSFSIAVVVAGGVLLIAITAASAGHSAAPVSPGPSSSDGHSILVGGSISTNLGAVDAVTTLGTATGDLRGALSAHILNVAASGANLTFTVQHHWVTESGDTLIIDTAFAHTTHVGDANSGLFAVTDYKLPIIEGTGRFAGAKGTLNLIGEVQCFNASCSAGQTVFRYSGKLLLADPD